MVLFANIFKTLRTANGYTQEDLAVRLNVSRSRLGMYENGSREPDFETLMKIADFFNVTTDYLIGRNDKNIYPPEYRIQDNKASAHINPEVARIAEELSKNKDLRILFDAARGSKPQDLKLATSILKRLKGT